MSWRPGWRGPAGYHCVNQPEMIELVEVVSGHDTAAETIGLLCGGALSAGRAPIHVRRAVPGFIANRLQYALLRGCSRRPPTVCAATQMWTR